MSKIISTLLHLFCTIMFLFQVIGNILKIGHTTSTKIKDVSLSSIHFPCIFRLVIRPGLDVSKLHDLGYDSLEDYFLGKSRFNSNVIGWGGHNEVGVNLATPKGEEVSSQLMPHLLF